MGGQLPTRVLLRRPGRRVASPSFAASVAALVVLVVLAAGGPATASEGDDELQFRACDAGCAPSGGGRPSDPILQATLWTCAADCRYRCMHLRVAARTAEGRPIVKYFGKWPFPRYLGMQEPASVALSLLNLATHAYCIQDLRHELSALPRGHRPYPYGPLWAGYAAINAAGWLASAAFHTRDTEGTQALDYMLAGAVVMYGLFAACVRAFGLRRPRDWAPAAGLLGALYARHAYYMLVIKFDYGYNMAACVAIGVTQSLAWLAWAWASRHPHRGRLTALVGVIHAAVLLELLDFPPLGGLLDAHAAWHAATPPLAAAWYTFVAADVRHVTAGEEGGGAADGGVEGRKKE